MNGPWPVIKIHKNILFPLSFNDYSVWKTQLTFLNVLTEIFMIKEYFNDFWTNILELFSETNYVCTVF